MDGRRPPRSRYVSRSPVESLADHLGNTLPLGSCVRLHCLPRRFVWRMGDMAHILCRCRHDEQAEDIRCPPLHLVGEMRGQL